MELKERIKEDIAKFNWADAAIAQLSETKGKLTVTSLDDEVGFTAVRAARMDMVKYRSNIEKVRKELKADSLEYGRQVDGEAKRLTELILKIENPLKFQEDWYINENKRIAEEKRLAEERAKWEAENAAKVAAQVEENARIERERIAMEKEQAEIAEARAKFEAEKIAFQQAQAKAAPAPAVDDLSWLNEGAETREIAAPAPLPVAAAPLPTLSVQDGMKEINDKIKYGVIARVKVDCIEMNLLCNNMMFRFDAEDDGIYDCDFGDVECLLADPDRTIQGHLRCILSAIKPCDAVQFWVAR